MKRPACQCGSGPRNRSRRQLLVLEWLEWMAPPQPPTPKEFQELCSSLKQCQPQTSRITYLNEQIKFQTNWNQPPLLQLEQVNRASLTTCAPWVGTCEHRCARCAPQSPIFLQGKPYHIYNLQFIKKAPLGKLNMGEIIIIRNISTQLKKSHYYSWHYTRVEFITIWANNGLAELGKNQPSLHFYQVLIYTWGGKKINTVVFLTSWYKRQTTM